MVRSRSKTTGEACTTATFDVIESEIPPMVLKIGVLPKPRSLRRKMLANHITGVWSGIAREGTSFRYAPGYRQINWNNLLVSSRLTRLPEKWNLRPSYGRPFARASPRDLCSGRWESKPTSRSLGSRNANHADGTKNIEGEWNCKNCEYVAFPSTIQSIRQLGLLGLHHEALFS